MRPWVSLALAFAALAAAQGSNNIINSPASGIQAEAGQPLTLTWDNPSSGTITLKLQTSGKITPGDGITLAENITNTGSATITIPPDVPTGQIYIQIIDDTDPDNYNFSAGFQAQGATNTATIPAATATSSPARSSNNSNASSSASDSASASSASDTSSADSSASSSESSASESSASESAATSDSASASSRAATSRTALATAGAQSTSAPSSAALPVKAQAGLMAAMLGAVAVLL